MYGNTVTNELWQFDLEEREWTLLDPEAINEITKTEQNRLAVVGHSAHVVRGIMYIIFGHSPIYGYMNTVQQCNICKCFLYLGEDLHLTRCWFNTGPVVQL